MSGSWLVWLLIGLNLGVALAWAALLALVVYLVRGVVKALGELGP